jgi:hypothetical protein
MCDCGFGHTIYDSGHSLYKREAIWQAKLGWNSMVAKTLMKGKG